MTGHLSFLCCIIGLLQESNQQIQNVYNNQLNSLQVISGPYVLADIIVSFCQVGRLQIFPGCKLTYSKAGYVVLRPVVE